MADRDHHPPPDPSSHSGRRPHWRFLQRFHWLRSSWFGYLASVLLIAGLFALEKLDEYLPQASIFIGTPFALASLLVALIWGLGPALISIVMGFITLVYFISSDVFTPDFLKDVQLDGPFLLAQLVAVVVVVQFERFHRQLKTAYHALTIAYHELASAHEEVETTRRQLEQANRLKESVITRAAHELRTPLTTILGRTQLLGTRLTKADHMPINRDAIQRDLETIEGRVLHLRALVESLFDLSCAQSFPISSLCRLLDLGDLCRKVVVDQGRISGHRIELDLPPQRLLILANEACITYVLSHLVQNAMTYASESTPIQIRVASDGHQTTLHVHNACQTLAPEQLGHLFEPFYRTPEVAYAAPPGWGLGLTICKEIVERSGGQIRAVYAQEQGLTLMITFSAESMSVDEFPGEARA